MTSRLRTVIPVWVGAVVGAVLIGALAQPDDYLAWMPIVMACLVFATFAIQLLVVQKDGMVDRMVLSLGGGILILALATLVLAMFLR